MTEPNNPFVGLLNETDSKLNTSNGPNHLSTDADKLKLNNVFQDIFHFTINPNIFEGSCDNDKQLIYLEELADSLKPNVLIDIETLEQALFERLLLSEPEAFVIPKTCKTYMEHVVQRQVFPYLFNAMQQLEKYEQYDAVQLKDIIAKIKELIFRNAVTALKQPALFDGQDFTEQIMELFKHTGNQSITFIKDIVKEFTSDGKWLLLIS